MILQRSVPHPSPRAPKMPTPKLQESRPTWKYYIHKPTRQCKTMFITLKTMTYIHKDLRHFILILHLVTSNEPVMNVSTHSKQRSKRIELDLKKKENIKKEKKKSLPTYPIFVKPIMPIQQLIVLRAPLHAFKDYIYSNALINIIFNCFFHPGY